MKFNIVNFLNIHKIRYYLYKRRLKSCGNYVRFSSSIKLFCAKKISIGENVHVGNSCIFSGHGGINIGNNISFIIPSEYKLARYWFIKIAQSNYFSI
mgnify:CR=1 FL=1